jgi:hypothetical protein
MPVYPYVLAALARDRLVDLDERARRAAARRAARDNDEPGFRPAMRAPAETAVAIRRATLADGDAVARLAALDSRPRPRGPLLVGERDGELVAALALEDGSVVANPFRFTSDVVSLLRLRAEQLRSSRDASARRLGAQEPLSPLAATP